MGSGKLFTREEVSEIISKRINKMNEKVDELKKENELLKEVLINAFKEWYRDERTNNGN